MKTKKKTGNYYAGRKRETFREIFTKRAAFALIAAAVCSGIFFKVMTDYEYRSVQLDILETMTSVSDTIQYWSQSDILSDDEADKIIESSLREYTHYTGDTAAEYSNMFFFIIGNSVIKTYDPEGGMFLDRDEYCSILTLTDDEGNIISSSREVMSVFLKFSSDDPYNGTMYCNYEEYPDLVQFRRDYGEATKTSTHTKPFLYPMLKSAYVNKEELRFIPSEISLVWKNNVRDYTINADIPEGYEYIVFNTENYNEPAGYYDFPCSSYLSFKGTPAADYDEKLSDYEINDLLTAHTTYPNWMGNSSLSYMTETGTRRIYYWHNQINAGGKTYYIHMVNEIEAWNRAARKVFFTVSTALVILFLIIALRSSIRRNNKNQARYAFEDYQRDLTNSLAHDLKTPLTAIGGYAENILDGTLSDTENEEYLRAILKNVDYTNSIINSTLELSRMNTAGELKNEKIDLAKLTNELTDKYSVMLSRRSVSCETEGSGEITADYVSLRTAAENLISNAVKYTPENGRILVTVSKNGITVKNTVNSKIDIKDLKKPFVKGDASRSGKLGSGLGLSIADAAAERNGFGIVLSCTDSEFTAELKGK